MVNSENIFDKIKDMFGEVQDSLNILEEQIDVDIQMQYYEYSKNHSNNFNPEEVIKNKEDIFHSNISIEDKKRMLVELASIDNIEAFRTIERYLKNANHNLLDWARLALQESKLLIESNLLDRNQVLISTGLGGKGLKLRYFVVIFSKTEESFSEFQKKIINSELSFLLKKHDAEIENINFEKDLFTLLSVIPLNVPIQDIFNSFISDCNQFGNFLNKEYLITNVKILTINEIREFLAENLEHFRSIN